MPRHYRRIILPVVIAVTLGGLYFFYGGIERDPLANIPIQLPDSYVFTESRTVDGGVEYAFHSDRISDGLTDAPIYITVFSRPILGFCALNSTERRCYGAYDPQIGKCYANPKYEPKVTEPPIIVGDFVICTGGDGDAGLIEQSLDIFNISKEEQYRVATVVESGVSGSVDLRTLVRP